MNLEGAVAGAFHVRYVPSSGDQEGSSARRVPSVRSRHSVPSRRQRTSLRSGKLVYATQSPWREKASPSAEIPARYGIKPPVFESKRSISTRCNAAMARALFRSRRRRVRSRSTNLDSAGCATRARAPEKRPPKR